MCLIRLPKWTAASANKSRIGQTTTTNIKCIDHFAIVCVSCSFVCLYVWLIETRLTCPIGWYTYVWRDTLHPNLILITLFMLFSSIWNRAAWLACHVIVSWTQNSYWSQMRNAMAFPHFIAIDYDFVIYFLHCTGVSRLIVSVDISRHHLSFSVILFCRLSSFFGVSIHSLIQFIHCERFTAWQSGITEKYARQVFVWFSKYQFRRNVHCQSRILDSYARRASRVENEKEAQFRIHFNIHHIVVLIYYDSFWLAYCFFFLYLISFGCVMNDNKWGDADMETNTLLLVGIGMMVSFFRCLVCRWCGLVLFDTFFYFSFFFIFNSYFLCAQESNNTSLSSDWLILFGERRVFEPNK